MKISIIIATFNSGHFVESCILSVLRQNVNDLEIIIIDGLSTDSTHKKIKPLISLHENIKFHSEMDLGIYDALNKGIKKSTGEIIGFVHSDDLLANDNILKDIITTFEKTNADGVYGDLQYIDKIDRKKIIRHWKSCSFTPKLLKRGWSPPHPTLYLKKSVYERHGYFDLNYEISSDYEFMIRIFSDYSLKFEYIPKLITKMRMGGVSNRNLKNIIVKSKEDYKAIRKHKLNGILTLLRKNTSKLNQFFKKS